MRRNGVKKPRCVNCCNCSCKIGGLELCPRKSKFTAERLTLLPGFVSKGVKSRDSSTSSDDDDSPVNPPQVRRSWRLSKKNHPVTVSGYFSKLLEDRGKSIFREIKERFEEEKELDDGFGGRLFESLSNFQVRDCEYYKKGVLEEIETVNKLLTGNGEKMSNRKRAYTDDDKENYPMKCPHIPPSNWVFQTPPNRKFNYNNVKVEDNGMKPAVIETRDDKKIVYEMNTKINVDLTGYSHNQEIDIDKRYMVEVAPTFTDESEEKTVFLPSEPFELENHFLSLTCRPKKAAVALPRFSTLKRKRGDIFEPQPGCSTDSDDYRPNVCFMENLNLNALEESFTFTFTSGDGDQGSTTGHLFDYEGNKKNSFNFRF